MDFLMTCQFFYFALKNCGEELNSGPYEIRVNSYSLNQHSLTLLLTKIMIATHILTYEFQHTL